MSTKEWEPGTGQAAGLQPGAGGGPLAAVLWDMDGLLVDSEPVWTVAETELMASLGAEFTPELKGAMVGSRLDVAVPLLLRAAGSDADPDEMGASLLARMVELFSAELPLMPGALELLDELVDDGVPCALVSSSYRLLVDAVLAGLPPRPDRHSRFTVTIAGDEVARGKPDPEAYRTAARRLRVDPAHCVVLEDSVAGTLSGEAAGCTVVAVPTVAVPEAAGRLVVPSLVDVTPSWLAILPSRLRAAS